MRLPATVLLIACVAMGCRRDLLYPAQGGGRAAGGLGGAGVGGTVGTGGDAVVTGAGGSVIDASAGVDSLAAADTSTTTRCGRRRHLGSSRARFLFIFYSPHGTVLDLWRPSGSGTNFTLSRILSPLSRVPGSRDGHRRPRQRVGAGAAHQHARRWAEDAPDRACDRRSVDRRSVSDARARSQVVAGTDVSARDLTLESSITAAFTNYDPSHGSNARSHREPPGSGCVVQPGSDHADQQSRSHEHDRDHAGVRVDRDPGHQS